MLTEDRPSYVVRPRPRVLQGETYEIETPLGTMFMTVNRTREGEFHEVFINVGKAGTDIGADAEAMGRLLSLVFRLGPSATSLQRLEAVIHQLRGIKGGQITTFNEERVSSIPDAIAKVLGKIRNPDSTAHQEQLSLNGEEEDVKPSSLEASVAMGELCPECGNYSVAQGEGCKKCLTELGGCGAYSVC